MHQAQRIHLLRRYFELVDAQDRQSDTTARQRLGKQAAALAGTLDAAGVIPPALLAPEAVALIESWPDPLGTYHLLYDIRDHLNSAFGMLSVPGQRLMTAENHTLVMYDVPLFGWSHFELSQSSCRIELSLEGDCICGVETQTGQFAIWHGHRTDDKR
jgi:hypothetical protein